VGGLTADELVDTAKEDLEIGVDVQEWSANLDEYAAVNPTTAGLALLDDADASAQRTTMGVAIGTNVQAWSANLDEYSAVNPTTAGLALLDDANAAAQLSTLGAQAALVSGTNIKTVNGESLVGSGDVVVTSEAAAINPNLAVLTDDLILEPNQNLVIARELNTGAFGVYGNTGSNVMVL